jgi:hypothetical protein
MIAVTEESQAQSIMQILHFGANPARGIQSYDLDMSDVSTKYQQVGVIMIEI